MIYASDSHSHTSFSPDGRDTVLAMAQRANALGLYAYAVTDHCECNDYDGALSGHHFKRFAAESYSEIKRVAQTYLGDTIILAGVEVGQPLQNLIAVEDLMVNRDYDFILASVHAMAGYEDFYYLDYEGMTEEYVNELLTGYFSELLKTVEWGGFDALAHLTYPLRYIKMGNGQPVCLDAHMDKIEAIFKTLIQSGKALEVNTYGLRSGMGCTLPSLSLLSFYREMGGRLVTLGSDAHTADDVGKGVEEGIEVLKQAGFREHTVFRRRQPEMLPLY